MVPTFAKNKKQKQKTIALTLLLLSLLLSHVVLSFGSEQSTVFLVEFVTFEIACFTYLSRLLRTKFFFKMESPKMKKKKQL